MVRQVNERAMGKGVKLRDENRGGGSEIKRVRGVSVMKWSKELGYKRTVSRSECSVVL